MAVDTSVIGKPTGAYQVRVERGPVEFFATAVKDDNPIYHDPSGGEGRRLRRDPGAADVLVRDAAHGQVHRGAAARPDRRQEPDARRSWASCSPRAASSSTASRSSSTTGRSSSATCSSARGRVLDVYEKESKGSIMTFIVIETAWRDEATGEPVVTEKFNLIHRRQAA